MRFVYDCYSRNRNYGVGHSLHINHNRVLGPLSIPRGKPKGDGSSTGTQIQKQDPDNDLREGSNFATSMPCMSLLS